ncbi:hypothetical protein [Psychroflexus maritimus]|uniref:Uncharacterized protein n=1 Tax=Psychroflexus maritimus TaxID=2714865 RepID=A0A967DYM6_9FLAO|nr:hypothetical protein [Psychroflexus maritimus]NGZ89283.1 hypothetical protein [Psychroflexus maritimus]
MKAHKNPTLADCICDLRTRKIKKITQIDALLDWGKISKVMEKHYKKGKAQFKMSQNKTKSHFLKAIKVLKYKEQERITQLLDLLTEFKISHNYYKK